MQVWKTHWCQYPMQTSNTVDNLNLGMTIIPFYSIFSISGKIKKKF